MVTEKQGPAGATCRRYTVNYMDCPRNVGPLDACGFCEEGHVWHAGLVVYGEDSDGVWHPTCDDCLEQSNPGLLKLHKLAWVLLRLAGSGAITPAMIEKRKRAWVAAVEGDAAAAARPLENLPVLNWWGDDGEFVAYEQAAHWLAERAAKDDARRELTSLIGPGKGVTGLDASVYRAAPESERAAIVRAARARAAEKQAAQESGADRAALGEKRKRLEEGPIWHVIPHATGYDANWWHGLVPDTYCWPFVLGRLQTVLADSPRPEGEELVTAVMEALGEAISPEGVALVIARAAHEGHLRLTDADHAVLTARYIKIVP